MKIPVQLKDPPKPPEKWWQSLQQVYQLVVKAINGNIEFGSPTAGPVNINGVWATVVTPVAVNTDFTVTHNLGRATVAYLLCTKNAACDVYTSPTANGSPNTQIILRATAAAVTLTIFLF